MRHPRDAGLDDMSALDDLNSIPKAKKFT
jgi:hypothetical protein